MMSKPEIIQVGNTTQALRPLIVDSWFPFDKKEYYWVQSTLR